MKPNLAKFVSILLGDPLDAESLSAASTKTEKEPLIKYTFIQKRYRTNQYIRADELRVITDDGKNLGVLKLEEALAEARRRGMDLIEIAPTAKPPVAKIMEFGKFKYQEERSEREHRPKKSGGEVKGLRIGFKTGKHDLEVRAMQAKKFLERGDMINIIMVLRGREKAHQNLAVQKFYEFLKLIPITVTLDGEPKRMPKGISGIIRKAAAKITQA